MQKAEKDATMLLTQAQDLAKQVLAQKQEVDVFVSQVKVFSGVMTGGEKHAAAGEGQEPDSAAERVSPEADRGYTPAELARLYGIPTTFNGNGRGIRDQDGEFVTRIRDQTGLVLWKNGDREASIPAFRGRPAFPEEVTANETLPRNAGQGVIRDQE